MDEKVVLHFILNDVIRSKDVMTGQTKARENVIEDINAGADSNQFIAIWAVNIVHPFGFSGTPRGNLINGRRKATSLD